MEGYSRSAILNLRRLDAKSVEPRMLDPKSFAVWGVAFAILDL